MKTPKMLLSIVACGLALSGVAVAQDDDDHGLINVRTTTVKPGKGQEYQELMGQLAAAREAAGQSGVAMYQVARGPAGTFYTVTAVENHAAFDEPFDSGMSDGDWQRWIGRITDLIDHSVVTILRTHGEMAIAPDSDSPPNLIQLRFTTLKPGSNNTHHEWLAESLVPALRAGGTEGYNVSEVRMGDVVNTWISARRVDSWAALDEPGPLAHLSDSAREDLFEGFADRVQSARVELIRFLPDLSY